MLFLFRQINSGGSFITNNDVARFVVIESTSKKKAFKKAKEVGLYFNGCEKGIDCSCCGDRWDRCVVYDSLWDVITSLWTLFHYSAWLEDDQIALIVYLEYEKQIYTLKEVKELFVEYVPELIRVLQSSLDNIAKKYDE